MMSDIPKQLGSVVLLGHGSSLLSVHSKNVVLLQWITSPPDQHGQWAGGVKFIVPYNLGMIG
jgi:hypothetical protein